MHAQPQVTHDDLTQLWDCLTDEFLTRASGSPAQAAVEDAIAAMHLTAHLVCRFIGDPRAVLRPTMTLSQLAEKLRRETAPVVQCCETRTLIETFGLTTGTIADSRWLLALWSLVMEMVTAAGSGTRIEVNIGTCEHGFEIEVGHDHCQSPVHEPQMEFPQTLIGRWLEQICPEWAVSLPACPLGGRAVQVHIPASLLRQVA